MKPVQFLLLNVAIVVVALVIYDQLRSERSTGRSSASRSSNTAEIEARLSALEAKSRPSRATPETSSRLDAPEASAHAAPGDPAPKKPRAGAKPAKGERRAKATTTDEPTEEEVYRFRQLQEAVRRQESVKRNWPRVSSALNKLSVNLTEEQREAVHFRYAAFEPRIREIWGEAKAEAQATVAAGGEVSREQIMTTTTATIQSEFAKTLTGVVDHQADAEAIAEALLSTQGKR